MVGFVFVVTPPHAINSCQPYTGWERCTMVGAAPVRCANHGRVNPDSIALLDRIGSKASDRIILRFFLRARDEGSRSVAKRRQARLHSTPRDL